MSQLIATQLEQHSGHGWITDIEVFLRVVFCRWPDLSAQLTDGESQAIMTLLTRGAGGRTKQRSDIASALQRLRESDPARDVSRRRPGHQHNQAALRHIYWMNVQDQYESSHMSLMPSDLRLALAQSLERRHNCARSIIATSGLSSSEAIAEILQRRKNLANSGSLSTHIVDLALSTGAAARAGHPQIATRSPVECASEKLSQSFGQSRNTNLILLKLLRLLFPRHPYLADSFFLSDLDRVRWRAGYTPLHFASECIDDPEMLQIAALLAQGSDGRDKFEMTAADYGRQQGLLHNMRILERLKSESRSNCDVDNRKGNHHSKFLSHVNLCTLTDTILREGWERVHWPDSFSILHFAAQSGALRVLRAFVEDVPGAAADMDKLDAHHMRPIDYARQAGHKDIVDYLSSRGVSTADGPGRSSWTNRDLTPWNKATGISVRTERFRGSHKPSIDPEAAQRLCEQLRSAQASLKSIKHNYEALHEEMVQLRVFMNALMHLSAKKISTFGSTNQKQRSRKLDRFTVVNVSIAPSSVPSDTSWNPSLSGTEASDQLKGQGKSDFAGANPQKGPPPPSAGKGPAHPGKDGVKRGKGPPPPSKGPAAAAPPVPNPNKGGGSVPPPPQKGPPPPKGNSTAAPNQSKGSAPPPPAKGGKPVPSKSSKSSDAGGKNSGGKKGKKSGKQKGLTGFDADSRQEYIVPKEEMKSIWWKKIKLGGAQQAMTVWQEIPDVYREFFKDNSALESDFVSRFSKKKATAAILPRPEKIASESAAEGGKKELKVLSIIDDPMKMGGLTAACKALPEPSAFALALTELDEAIIDVNTLEWIKRELRPEPAQMQALQDLRDKHPNVALGLPETYMWAIGKEVKEYEKRIDCWLFIRTYEERCRNCTNAYRAFRAILQCMRTSKGFRRLLGLILCCGNYLNGSSSRGQADGFDMDALTLLDSVKGRWVIQ